MVVSQFVVSLVTEVNWNLSTKGLHVSISPHIFLFSPTLYYTNGFMWKTIGATFPPIYWNAIHIQQLHTCTIIGSVPYTMYIAIHCGLTTCSNKHWLSIVSFVSWVTLYGNSVSINPIYSWSVGVGKRKCTARNSWNTCTCIYGVQCILQFLASSALLNALGSSLLSFTTSLTLHGSVHGTTLTDRISAQTLQVVLYTLYFLLLLQNIWSYITHGHILPETVCSLLPFQKWISPDLVILYITFIWINCLALIIISPLGPAPPCTGLVGFYQLDYYHPSGLSLDYPRIMGLSPD